MSGIYIHIPFCKQACHYCDFHFSTSLAKKDRMIMALKKELVLRKDEFKEETVETIYFGGGTPSVLRTSEINDLIQTVYSTYNVVKQPEITLEANPDDLTVEKVGQLAESPINRLSIGVQSFFEEDLKLMNRAHNAKEAEQCIKEAANYFKNISIDLIYGIPEMTDERWKQNIEKALSFEIPHISSYALTIEPKTALASFIKKGLIKPTDDAMAQRHFRILYDILSLEGYDCYEVSNFGKPGYYSKNNTAYWLGKKYMGIGPSAHSYDGGKRSWNISNNPKYLKAIAEGQLPITHELLSLTDKYNEYVMTGLRTSWGISLDKIRERFGEKYYVYITLQMERYIAQELLSLSKNQLVATKKGKFLVDGIASDLFILN
ncbi:radical SAM family heme chaperone HemW [Maribacter arenosus]|uniref:Heme chaperone HemW n=1 Tax=Maribacter arenosus TaxID=1854708 RepID=A0ABR7VCW4_9FLAO|nr:radical SAM family heme chaperone HemW [Maribacter arenosus]MBD0850108.1 radical SAM family heme chaperone HemW [Maribacter arenosus]